ncbi:uncharacterized protein J3D65DRAFT_638648 [Phyllosticta citribraziliensis]|uniref:NACHT domain-containing protein n=1 Tax=Phyllosticta citribraziliensis TaxID=989973 RepID=A0ABR1LBB5_9PEZI
MAELIGLIASCITLAELTTKTCLIARKHIHSDRAVSKELNALTEKISSYKGLIDLIKLQAEIDKDDAERLSALACVDGPLETSRAALRDLNLRLEQLSGNKILGKFVLGKIIDDKTAAQLRRFDNALPILQLALDSDQRVITSKVLEYTKNTSKDVSDVKDMLFQRRDERDAAAQANVRQAMKSWLNTFDPTAIHHLSRQKQTSGSGRWFLDHEFSTWIQAEPSERKKILWLLGRSGMGKTVLLSSAIDHLRKGIGLGAEDAVAYFYCSSSESTSQSAVNMMKSCIRQLLDQFPDAEDLVKPFYEDFIRQPQGTRTEPPLADFLELLQKVCALPKKVALFLDAVNEVGGEDINRFFDAISWSIARIPNFQIMISCTKALNPVLKLKGSAPVLIDMEQTMVNSDIAGYVVMTIKQDARLSKLRPRLQKRIHDEILSNAHGSFRWAECQLQLLKDKAFFPRDVEAALSSMPPSLEDHYLEALRSVPTAFAPFIRAALAWLRFSVRPMKLDELTEAMTLDTSDPVALEDRIRPSDTEDILKGCGSLISYDAEHQRVQLAHDSVRQFLLSKPPPDSGVEDFFQDQDMDVNYLCCVMLDYLNMPCFAFGVYRDLIEAEIRWKHWPLFPYTSKAIVELFKWSESKLMPRIQAGFEKLAGKSSTTRYEGNIYAFAEANLFETDPALWSKLCATEPPEKQKKYCELHL